MKTYQTYSSLTVRSWNFEISQKEIQRPQTICSSSGQVAPRKTSRNERRLKALGDIWCPLHMRTAYWYFDGYLNRKIHCSFLNYHELIPCITHRSPFAVPSDGRIQPDDFQGTPNMAPKLVQKRPVRNGAPGSSASWRSHRRCYSPVQANQKHTSLAWFQVLLAFCLGKKCCHQISSW